MANSSFINLVDLVSRDNINFSQTPPQYMTVPGVISTDVDGRQSKYDSNALSPEEIHHRMIVVANFLPLNAKKDDNSGRWCFSYDEDSIFRQLKYGLSYGTDVVYVGSLKVDVDESEQETVSLQLLEEFKCVPTFMPSEIQKKFYDGFCKNYIWPLFHYIPMYDGYCNRFDRSLWQAYVSSNRIFADKVIEVLNPINDYVWVHDYHLMVLPSFLRRRFTRVRLGFFLHSPFPSPDTFYTIPVRAEILRAMLNVDLIGFQTFDYARHFLYACSRIIGLEYESKRKRIEIEYSGRTIFVETFPVGIHMDHIQSALNHPSASIKAKLISKELEGKKLIVGIDDIDLFKGVNLKFLAYEELLKRCPTLCGDLVLLQILNPPMSNEIEVKEAKEEIYMIAKSINERFGNLGYKPVVIIDEYVTFNEKVVYYALAECCIINPMRYGMNLDPYNYVVCRQGSPKFDEVLDIASDSPRTSSVIVSEFVGCSPFLSGAIRVDPRAIKYTAKALEFALTVSNEEKQGWHKMNYEYVSSHDVAYWAKCFEQYLFYSCKDHYAKLCWGIGFGFDFRVLSLSPSFKKLSLNGIVSAYKSSKCRAIFLDYDGTIVPQNSTSESPDEQVKFALNYLSDDINNTVFIVSERKKTSLSEWFDQCWTLGLAAEHGCFIRWGEASWKMNHGGTDFAWQGIVEPLMRAYTNATEGSYTEIKDSALVWHYRDDAYDFGSWQATKLLNQLESVLANEPVVVKKWKHMVEVKLQGITKGSAVDEVLSTLTMSGKSPDFVLCIGDDRPDEDMFESILNKSFGSTSSSPPEIFTCTVGQKPSKARYYLDDTMEVNKLLKELGDLSAIDAEPIAAFYYDD